MQATERQHMPSSLLWRGLPIAVVALGFLPLFVMAAQTGYLLIAHDFRSYEHSQQGSWPRHLVSHFTLEAGGWLYRPFPELVEWLFSALFRGHPGLWHLVMLGFRLINVLLAFKLLRLLGTSSEARLLGTVFVAFFPSFPESQLPFAETLLVPLLTAVLVGVGFMLTEEARDVPAKMGRVAVATVVAFVLFTMCKEILAPVSVIVLIAVCYAVWTTRPAGWRAWVGIAVLATTFQVFRCYQALSAPYANPEGSRSVLINLKWIIATEFLWNTNTRLTGMAVIVLTLLGGWQVTRWGVPRFRRTYVITGLCAAVFTMHVAIHAVTPYHAIRFLYPAAVVIAPLLAQGCDLIGTWHRKAQQTLVILLVVTFALFNAPVLWAQAAGLHHSSVADWTLLTYLADRHSEGRTIGYFGRTVDPEPFFWIDKELHGLNLTGRVREGAGRVVEIVQRAGLEAMPRGSILVVSWDDAARLLFATESGFREQTTFSSTSEGSRFDRVLEHILVLGQALNRSYTFLADAGSPPFPGRRWRVLLKHA